MQLKLSAFNSNSRMPENYFNLFSFRLQKLIQICYHSFFSKFRTAKTVYLASVTLQQEFLVSKGSTRLFLTFDLRIITSITLAFCQRNIHRIKLILFFQIISFQMRLVIKVQMLEPVLFEQKTVALISILRICQIGTSNIGWIAITVIIMTQESSV